uniref:Opsin n=1 Tax=Triops granarius TaxID=109777 RepID=B6EUW3_9CRUS|nr:opsin [Triops granarius]
MANASHYEALQQEFNPWALPESFTLYAYAPEDVRAFLHPHWHNFPATHPAIYYLFGLVYLVLGVTSVGGNYLVLRIFTKFQELRRPSNVLVINLALSDMLLMLTLFPECVYNFLSGGPWRFGDLGCQIHAFCGALFGYNQITTLVFISYDRFNVIVRGMGGTPLTYARVSAMVAFSWLWATGWSVAPLVGWGGYALDGMLGTCSFDYVTRTWNNRSHILAATAFMWVIPVLIIAGCYWFIVQAVFKHEAELKAQAKKMNVASLRSNADQQQVSAEIRIAKVAITNVVLWLSAWTPFMVISNLGIWADPQQVTPLVSSLPVLLSKTSCSYNPLVYAISHPKYRECLKTLVPWICIVLPNDRRGGDNVSSSSSRTEASGKAETVDA